MPTTRPGTIKYAANLLDSLKTLDIQTQEAYYEMGRMLSAFFHDKLYDLLGYESFKHMVEEELSFSVASAYTYRATYDQFKLLGYNKTEAVELIIEFGFTNMHVVLAEFTQKVSKRTIKAKLKDIETHAFAFSLDNAAYAEVMEAFVLFGAVFGGKDRMTNASEVFLDIVRTARATRFKKGAA